MTVIKTSDFFDDGYKQDLQKIADEWRNLGEDIENVIKQLKKAGLGYRSSLEQMQGNTSGGQEQIKKMSKEIQQLQKAIERFEIASSGAGQAQAFWNEQTRKANYKNKVAAQEVMAQAGSYNELSASLKKALIDIKNINVSTLEGSQEFDEAAKSITRMRKSLKDMDAQMNSHRRNVGNYRSGIKGLVGLVKRLAAVYLGFEAFRSAVITTKELTVETNSLRLAYSKIIPDSNKLAKTNKFLSETADNYGINLNTLRKNYLRFTAASKSTNLSMEETQAIFNSVAKAGSVMGLEAIRMDRAFNALEQMLSKGKVSSEELRQQLGDSLPGSMEIMADALGKTTEELSKMLEEGKVLSEDALPKFAKQLEITYGIENLNRVENLVAAQGRLKTSIINLVDALGAENVLAKFYDTIAKGVDYVTKLLEGNTGAVSANVRALQEQKIELNVLVQEITDLNTSEKRRSILIGQLNAKYPKFLEGLSKEEQTNANIKKRLDELNAAYVRKIALQTIEDDVQEQVTKSLNAQNLALDKQNKLREMFTKRFGEEEANRMISISGGSILNAMAAYYKDQTGRDLETFTPTEKTASQVSPRQMGGFVTNRAKKEFLDMATLYKEINDLQLESNEATNQAIELQKKLNKTLEAMGFGLEFFEPSGKTDTTDTTDTGGSSKEEIHAERLAEIELQRIFVEYAEESFKKIAALRVLDLEKAELIRDQDIHNAKEGTSDKFDAEQEYLKQKLEINLRTLNDIKDLQDKYDKEEEDSNKRKLELKKEQLSIQLQIQDNEVKAQNLDKQQEELEILGNKILYLRALRDLETDITKQKLIQSQIDAAESEFIAKSTQGVDADTKKTKDAKIFGFSLRKGIKKLLPEEVREDEKKVDAAFEAVVSGFALAKDAMTDYYRTAIQLSNELVQQRNQEVASAERALEREIASRNAGYANFVDDAQKRLDQAKKNQEEALRQRQAFQRQQLIADSISQASGLTLAAVNIFKQFPFPLGLAFVAPMFGAFVAAKAKAFELTRQNFAEGDLSIIGGGRHGSGNDTLVGFSGGRAQFAEQGEARMILSRRATARYADILPTLFDQLSNGTFNADSMIGRNSYIQPSAVIVNTDTTRVEKELVAIRRQGEIQTIYDNGKKVVIKGNRTKRYV